MHTKALSLILAAGILGSACGDAASDTETAALDALAASATIDSVDGQARDGVAIDSGLVDTTVLDPTMPVIGITYIDGQPHFTYEVSGGGRPFQTELYNGDGHYGPTGGGQLVDPTGSARAIGGEQVRYGDPVEGTDFINGYAPHGIVVAEFQTIGGFEVDTVHDVIRYAGNGGQRRTVTVGDVTVVAEDGMNQVPGGCECVIEGGNVVVVDMGEHEVDLTLDSVVTIRTYGAPHGLIQDGEGNTLYDNTPGYTSTWIDHVLTVRTARDAGRDIRDNGDQRYRFVFDDVLPDATVRVTIRRNGAFVGNWFGIADANGNVNTSALVINQTELQEGDEITIGERRRENGTYVDPDFVSIETFVFEGDEMPELTAPPSADARLIVVDKPAGTSDRATVVDAEPNSPARVRVFDLDEDGNRTQELDVNGGTSGLARGLGYTDSSGRAGGVIGGFAEQAGREVVVEVHNGIRYAEVSSIVIPESVPGDSVTDSDGDQFHNEN